MTRMLQKIVFIDDIITDHHTAVGENQYIEHLAKSIIKLGGCTLHPIIVRRIGIDKYELIGSKIPPVQYFAALRAKEIDSSVETINVFICETEADEECAKAQLI